MATLTSALLKTARKAVKKVKPTKVVAAVNKSKAASKADDIATARKLKHMRLIKSAAGIGSTAAMLIDNTIDESKKNKQNILKNKKNAAKVKANAAKVEANKKKVAANKAKYK